MTGLTQRIALAALAGALALVAQSSTAGAGDADEVPSRFFQTYDRDGDGRVTPDELGGDPDIFRLLDKDADGAVTPQDLGPPAELTPRRVARRDAPQQPGRRPPGPGRTGPDGDRWARLRALDKDGDGKISREEFPGPDRAFAYLDRNGDGVIDETDRPAGQAPGPRGPGPAGPGGTPQALARLAAMDKDGDGRVSRAEYQGDRPFERLDRNQDGYLDRDDLAAPPTPGMPADDAEAIERFARLDTNADGKLDASELVRPEVMERLDRDGDGVCTQAEFFEAARARRERPRAPSRLTEQAFRRFDADRDGRVTRDEYPGDDEHFRELDRDGDGVLTDADRAGPAERRDTPATLEELLKRDDVDGDGRVARREFQGSNEEFDGRDRNQDGFIDDRD